MIFFKDVLGWVLLVAGGLLIWWVLNFALNRQIVEAMALSLPAVIVFRSGVGFLKLAMAERIAKGINRAT